MKEGECMISVCMASYNGEKYIGKQIESILSQLSDNDELIVSDDGSIDQTLQIISHFNDKRIKILKNNSHCYTKNFENALNHAKGEYIFLSDQDDIWRYDKVKVAVEYLQKYDFIISNARIVDSESRVMHKSRNDMLPVKNGFINNLIKTRYLGCCMVFKKQVRDSVIPFPSNRNLCSHDAWIAMVSELMFKTRVCEECLIDYRRHESNVSNGSVGVTNSLWRMIKIRVYLLIEVLKRGMQLKIKRNTENRRGII